MIELLSPAGDFEKLKAAILYGANAVYLAGQAYGMRAASNNFSEEELIKATEYCHERNVKIYVTINIMPRDNEYEGLENFIRFLDAIKVDAVIISDLGVFSKVREIAPDLEIHISTQASTVSAAACNMWYKLGAKRVVLARELSLEEIKTLKKGIPEDLEIEAFIHGSMCIAYSGRCLMSNYFVSRDANHGMCAQPCRWIFNAHNEMKVSEEKRPEDQITIEQDNGDTFVMSSKDTCMIEHIPELVESGITSFKIEGRVKSAYYTAVVTNTYRMAIDAYLKDKENYKYDPLWLNELESVSHREYATGFYFGNPHDDANIVTMPGYLREKAYIATAISDSDENGRAMFIQRNKLTEGEKIEILSPGKVGVSDVALDMYNEQGKKVESAPHPSMIFSIKTENKVKVGDIIRQA